MWGVGGVGVGVNVNVGVGVGISCSTSPHPHPHPTLLYYINEWERQSIEAIKNVAKNMRLEVKQRVDRSQN